MSTHLILYPSTKGEAYLNGEVSNEEVVFVVSSWRKTCQLFRDKEQNKLTDHFIRHVGKQQARVVMSALDAYDLSTNTTPAI